MVFAGFVAVLIVVGISLFGWGTLANRLTRDPVRNRVVVLCVGLAVIVFLGGMLNLLRLAYGWAFDGLILGGIALAVGLNKSYRPSLPNSKDEWRYVILIGIVILLTMGVTIATQLPPRAYNFHDDFEKYFTFPVRMLQTGTLFGSPLSAIGLETLGGQAVLQAIIINHLPISYLNGVDAVFGLLLCLILPISMVPRRLAFLPVSLGGVLLVLFINPQYVNISSLYIASAFMMATIVLLSQKYENENEKSNNLPPPILISLMYAALFTLKSSLPVFPAFQGVLFCIAMALSGVPMRRLAKWGLSTVLFTLLFLSPWVLLHLPNYIHHSSVPLLNEVPASAAGELDLFSFRPLFYGGSFALYTALALAAGTPLLIILLGKLAPRVVPHEGSAAAIAASGTAIICSYLFFIMLGSQLVGYDINLRYTIPFLIAGTPMIMTLTILWVLSGNAVSLKNPIAIALILFGLLIIAGFSESLMHRMQQAFRSGNILAFSNMASSQNYLDYNDFVLHGKASKRIAAVQKMVPAGQAIMAWVTTPFYLDYKRNVVFDVDNSGLGSPWAHIPDEVEYFIVEYKGYGVFPVERYYDFLQDPGRKLSAEIVLAFLKTIRELSQKGDILYDDGSIVVFRSSSGAVVK